MIWSSHRRCESLICLERGETLPPFNRDMDININNEHWPEEQQQRSIGGSRLSSPISVPNGESPALFNVQISHLDQRPNMIFGGRSARFRVSAQISISIRGNSRPLQSLSAAVASIVRQISNSLYPPAAWLGS